MNGVSDTTRRSWAQQMVWPNIYTGADIKCHTMTKLYSICMYIYQAYSLLCRLHVQRSTWSLNIETALQYFNININEHYTTLRVESACLPALDCVNIGQRLQRYNCLSFSLKKAGNYRQCLYCILIVLQEQQLPSVPLESFANKDTIERRTPLKISDLLVYGLNEWTTTRHSQGAPNGVRIPTKFANQINIINSMPQHLQTL